MAKAKISRSTKKSGGGSHKIGRMTSFDAKNKGKKAKLAVLNPKTSAGLSGNFWPLEYPFSEKGKNKPGLTK